MVTEYLIDIIKNDVCRHDLIEHSSSWPPAVSQTVQGLQNALRLPTWVEFGPYPPVDAGLLPLLNGLHLCDSTSTPDSSEFADLNDLELDRRFMNSFGMTLSDCRSIQHVLDADSENMEQNPKESFLIVLVRNILCHATSELVSLEDVPVCLPRHSCGEVNPLVKFISKSVCAPLVISFVQKLPFKDDNDGNVTDVSSEKSKIKDASVPVAWRIMTMSEFLKPVYIEEEEEEEEVIVMPLPPQFDAHFVDYPLSTTTPPSVCCIPVLFVAEEERLPVLMSSLLYQRRVWHIHEPLIGIEFSRYETVIKLHVGWLEDTVTADRVLPRVHITSIQTATPLDLSSPIIALSLSHLLHSLDPQTFAVRDGVGRAVDTFIGEIHARTHFAWRIDTHIEEEGPYSNEDLIIRWAEGQNYKAQERKMSGRPARVTRSMTSPSSAGLSTDGGQQSSDTGGSSGHLASPSQSSQPTENTSIPAIREPAKPAKPDKEKETVAKPPSCSAFAKRNTENDSEVLMWIFDRKVLPRSLASDQDFFQEYNRITGLIWPAEWMERKNCPSVDNGVVPLLDKLHSSILNMFNDTRRKHLLEICSAGQFPVDLRIFADQPSTILQASLRSMGKLVESQHEEKVAEVSWRHDHDRLVFDFFMRPLHGPSKSPSWSILFSRDQSARPALGKTLRFPKSDSPDRNALLQSLQLLPALQTLQLEQWLQEWSFSADISATARQETRSRFHIEDILNDWRLSPPSTAEPTVLSPVRGRCDAIGCSTVTLPGVKAKAIEGFPLVIRASGQQQGQKTSTGKKPASTSPSLPPQYSAFSSRCSYILPEELGSEPVDALAAGVQAITVEDDGDDDISGDDDLEVVQERIVPRKDGSIPLDLPILVVEYKKEKEKPEVGTNHLRMYLTAAVKFLETIGINNFTVYGMQSEGPVVAFSAAVLKEDGIIHLFERHMQEINVSTPIGAWHLATVLSRLAIMQSKVLQEKFDVVKSELIEKLRNADAALLSWTRVEQLAQLKAAKVSGRQ